MKKRILSAGCIIMICLTLGIQVNAMDSETIDGSKLTHQNESVGYAEQKTRGEYLLTGYSKCVKMNDGRLYAGGTTIAVKEVASIQVAVMIERAKKGDDTWEYYESWEKINHNMDRVGSNRALAVEGGYYYRVRSYHAANGDASSSYTDGIYIE